MSEGARPLRVSLEHAVGVKPDSAAIARALGLLYIAGPTIALIGLLLPHSPNTNETGIAVLIAIAYLMVPVLFSTYTRLPPTAFSFFIVLANTLATLVIYFNGEADSAYAFFYLWVTPYAAVFYGKVLTALHVAYAAAAYAVVLAVLESEGHGIAGNAEVEHWMMAIVTLSIAALLVRALTSALRENLLRIDAERRRRAIEINDNIVQGLVVAQLANRTGRREEGDDALDETLERAREIITELLGDDDPKPGDLRRDRAAGQ